MIYLNKKDINKVASLFNDNKLIAFPTETVYGLGIIATSNENFNRLVEVKHRSPNKPFTLMISNILQVKDIIEINDLAKKILELFTPGPLTLILRTKKDVPQFLDLGTGFIGIRIPNDQFILDVINIVNKPLLVPSANPSDLPPATNKEEVYNYFKENIDYIVEGDIKSNIPSTIIKVDGNEVTLIREGELKFNKIKEKLYENSIR